MTFFGYPLSFGYTNGGAQKPHLSQSANSIFLENEHPIQDTGRASAPPFHCSAPESRGEGSSYVERTKAAYTEWFVHSDRLEKEQKYVRSLNASLDFFKASEYSLAELEKQWTEAHSSPHASLASIYERHLHEWHGSTPYLEWAYNACSMHSSPSFLVSSYCELKALTSADLYATTRLQYSDLLRHMRNALTSEEYETARDLLDPKSVYLIEDLCYDKFTSNYFFNYWADWLDTLCDPISENLDFEKLSDTLTANNEKLLRSDPSFRKEKATLNIEKLEGSVGFSFDPVGKSNIPKKRSQQEVANQEGSWTLARLAHGTPTIEGNLLKKLYRFALGHHNAAIIPEYKAFLTAAKRRGERILYVNLQKTSGLENDRSMIIEKIQEDPAFQNTFCYMSLPMDGPAFKDLRDVPLSTQEFKTNLLALFFNGQNELTISPAKLPKDLTNAIENDPALGETIANELRNLIEKVHENYFQGEELQTSIDRQDFIMQFYSDLTDYITSMDYLQKILGRPLEDHERIAFVVQPCKDNKDRGGAKNGIDEAKYILLTYPLDDPQALHQALYDLYVNTLGAYTIKFEEILTDRLIYFTSLLKRYGKLAQDPSKIQKIRDSQPGYFRLLSHKSAREFDPGPRASVPTMSTALTREAYLKDLKTHLEISRELPDFHEQLKAPYKEPDSFNAKELFIQLERDLIEQELWVDGIPYSNPKDFFVNFFGIPEEWASSEAIGNWNPSFADLEFLSFFCLLQRHGPNCIYESAQSLFTPKYADLQVSQPHASPLQQAFQELRAIYDQLGHEYLLHVLKTIGFTAEEHKIHPEMEEILDWVDIEEEPELKTSIPLDPNRLLETFKTLCEEVEGKQKALDHFYWAIRQKYFPSLSLEQFFSEKYIPRSECKLHPIKITANTLDKTVHCEASIFLIDGSGRVHTSILGEITADLSRATLVLSLEKNRPHSAER